MKQLPIILSLIGVLLLGGIYYKVAPSTNLSGTSLGKFNQTSVTSTHILAATKTQLVGSQGTRDFVSIQVHGATNVYCLLDGDKTAAQSNVTTTGERPLGFVLTGSSSTLATSYWESYTYTGAINCVAEAATTSTVTTAP